MTPEQYKTFLENCDYSETNDIVTLINNTYTAQAFREELLLRQVNDPSNISAMFSRMWEMETFPDGIGDRRMTEIYTPPRFSSGFNMFQYDDETCDDDWTDLTRCQWCYEDIKSGGVMSMESRIVRRAAKTRPICLENIRSKPKFQQWVRFHLEDRYAWETQAAADFINLVLLRTAGHKILLEKDHPRANQEPQSPLPMFPSTFLKEFFVKPVNPEDNLLALSIPLLNVLAQNMQDRAMFAGAKVATGVRGEPIYDAFIDSDMYWTLLIQNPDWAEKMKYTMPEKLFSGYNSGRYDNLERQVVGNFAFRTNINLPRFAINSATGGLIMVQPTRDIDTENGEIPVINEDWSLAPIGMLVIPSPNQTRLLARPGINIPDIPLTMLEGLNEWTYWNKYDKECNEEENIFHFRYKMRRGWEPKRPDEALVILYRRPAMANYLQNTCNVLPMREVAALTGCTDASLLDPACELAGRRNVEADITEAMADADTVRCSAETCGSETLLKIKIPFVNGRVGGVIDVVCDATVLLGLSDDSQITGTLVDNSLAGTRYAQQGIYYVEIAEALDEGVCVEWIMATDGTGNVAPVVACIDSTTDEELDAGEIIIFISGGPLFNIGTGDAFSMAFNSGSAKTGTVTAIDNTNLKYTLDFTDNTVTCATQDGMTTITVTP